MSLVITIWDVQHGSAAYVRTPNGEHIVVDLGVGSTKGSGQQFSPLQHLYYRHGVQQLDEVIITHPHRDHLDDIANFDLMNPKIVRCPRHLTELEIRSGNQSGDAPILDRYFEISRRYSGIVQPWQNPESSLNNGGVDIRCFAPSHSSTSNLNNHSIVTFFSFAGFTICLPGDNESPSWRELLEDRLFQSYLACTTVLIAAHHGREAGYCEDIFKLFSPSLVVVSDGPCSDTSAVEKYRAKAQGWKVRSRSLGTVSDRYVLTTRCDGVILIECERLGNHNFLSVSID